MNCVLKTAPALEPISLAELKLHLRLDSETFAGDVTTYQSILPGSHAIANDYATHAGTVNSDVVSLLNGFISGLGATTVEATKSLKAVHYI